MFWIWIKISFLRSVFEYDILGWPSCCSGPARIYFSNFILFEEHIRVAVFCLIIVFIRFPSEYDMGFRI